MSIIRHSFLYLDTLRVHKYENLKHTTAKNTTQELAKTGSCFLFTFLYVNIVNSIFARVTFYEGCYIITVVKGADYVNTYEFGKFLSLLRKEKGLTQMQLAEKLNVTDKAISRWETGKNYPDIEMFESLSNILDVSISELLEGKRIEREDLFNVSEEQIVEQIKKNKKSNKKYRIVIIIVILFAVVLGCIAMKANGVFDGVIYNEIPCYSNDVITIMNNVDGYISQRPEADGDFVISDGFFFIEDDKTTNDVFYLSGTCENGRAFYINTMYDGSNPENSNCFIGEFRENQECVDGVAFDDLKRIVSQLDLSVLPAHEKYELSLMGIDTYHKQDLNSNEYQKSIKKFIFSEGVLQRYTEEMLSGEFLLITITGFDNSYGHIIAYIFYEI